MSRSVADCELRFLLPIFFPPASAAAVLSVVIIFPITSRTELNWMLMVMNSKHLLIDLYSHSRAKRAETQVNVNRDVQPLISVNWTLSAIDHLLFYISVMWDLSTALDSENCIISEAGMPENLNIDCLCTTWKRWRRYTRRTGIWGIGMLCQSQRSINLELKFYRIPCLFFHIHFRLNVVALQSVAEWGRTKRRQQATLTGD